MAKYDWLKDKEEATHHYKIRMALKRVTGTPADEVIAL